jgi:ATP-dependent 26S proteasome regulatory subunit
MEASSLPPAVVRSGRIELWLETRLPDEKSRAVILSEKLSKLPLPIGEADVAMLARASRGLTGADLKAAVEDGKLLFAYDKAAGKTLRPSEVYFLDAIDRIRCNRRTYAKRRTPQFAEMQFGFHME